MRQPGFIGPAYTLSTVPLDCQRCVGLYPEPDELTTGKDGSIGALVSIPGLTKALTLPLSPVRGLYTVSFSGTMYAVGGNTLYTIDSSNVATALGTLKTSTGAVSFSDNGSEGGQLILVDGLYGYILNLANNQLITLDTQAFHACERIVFINGYFVGVNKGTQQFFWSTPYDGTQWNGLDFATAEGNPDKAVTLITLRSQLAILGTQSLEVYYNAGDPLSAFTYVPGSLIEHGCAAALSVAKTGDLVLWLGRDEYGNGVIWKAAGYQAVRASNYGVELAIQGYGDISDATAFVYQQRGHTFYVLNFTNAGTTWVLDVDLGTWHERQSITADGTSLGRWRADNHTFAYNSHYVGDYLDGRIYKLDFNSFTEDGKVLTRLRRAPHLSGNMKRVIHQKAQLDARVGVGTNGNTDTGENPTVMLRWSDDGGLSWSSEMFAPLGRIGQTYARVLWRRLGHSRNRVYEVKVTDPVDVALIGFDIDAVGADS